MQTMTIRKRTLSLLLVLAMLTLAFVSLFPATVAAEPAEIQNFGWQASKDFTVAGPSELRFVFTIGSLDYDEVGFVFSFESYGNVKTPAVDTANCHKVKVTTAYKTITVDGEPTAAPGGRWWVAAKVTNIPQTEYNNNIYVRAFVKDGEETRYSGVETIDPYTAYRTDGSIQEYIGTDTKTNYADLRNVYTDVLQSGAKTFCPTNENPTGNDLYIEYSVLYSKYLTETYLKATAGPYVVSGVAKGTSMQKALIYWDPCASKSDCGFETTGNFDTIAAGDPGYYPNIDAPSVFADKPHVGGSDENNPESGWHRIGIRYHEEVTNVEDVKGGLPAEYYLTMSLYIDGNLVLVLCADDNKQNDYDLKLYTAQSDGKGGITYTDVAKTNGDQSVYVYRLMNYQWSGYVKNKKDQYPYCAFADCYATCGKNFVQQVERVNSPAASNYATSDGSKSVTAPVYYRITN